MGTSNDSNCTNDNGAVSSINNDDDKGKQYKDNDYDKTMSITATTTATSTSYLAEMDNSNVEVNEVAIATNVIEVS